MILLSLQGRDNLHQLEHSCWVSLLLLHKHRSSLLVLLHLAVKWSLQEVTLARTLSSLPSFCPDPNIIHLAQKLSFSLESSRPAGVSMDVDLTLQMQHSRKPSGAGIKSAKPPSVHRQQFHFRWKDLTPCILSNPNNYVSKQRSCKYSWLPGKIDIYFCLIYQIWTSHVFQRMPLK